MSKTWEQDIPSTGMEGWRRLSGRSSRSQVPFLILLSYLASTNKQTNKQRCKARSSWNCGCHHARTGGNNDDKNANYEIFMIITHANDEMFMRLYLHHMWCRVQHFQPGVSVKFWAENGASVKKLQMSVTCLWLRRCWSSRGKRSKISSGFVLGNNGQLATLGAFIQRRILQKTIRRSLFRGELSKMYIQRRKWHILCWEIIQMHLQTTSKVQGPFRGIWIGFAKVYFHTNLGAILCNIQEISQE